MDLDLTHGALRGAFHLSGGGRLFSGRLFGGRLLGSRLFRGGLLSRGLLGSGLFRGRLFGFLRFRLRGWRLRSGFRLGARKPHDQHRRDETDHQVGFLGNHDFTPAFIEI